MSRVPAIVLASGSPYRRALLERLGLPFEHMVPDADETPRDGEPPRERALRLAEAKARGVCAHRPHALVIGADQVATLDGEMLRKPGTHEHTVDQLARASGRRATFFTGLCLVDARSGRSQCDVVPYAVVFRRLSRRQIEAYVRREKPYDCAGGFKAEGLGVSLFQRMEGQDPTALIGLPLIRLVDMFQNAGLDVLLLDVQGA
ncbi:MAG: septum formation inhibitor Maf [Gammaproteobacteria bacterium]|nr:septum formation inhibitor Maf [Gammaproteobacteria bacterium]NIR85705.1 septum formation inhibitor Maf [Gammaproteobacteria bacterium]NIR90238.1 septum formation inhibitor Maf [Gammaproteobacteria bacterium]NIU06839.1 septum formation inhibitor Maf [Gammaproteobacteria bacterium]NIV53772.1 septum formation inhibitor Maf [Gammaproteobacteria bacterium]